MAIAIDFATLIITVPQADLTLVSGSLYELPTEDTFRADVNALMDDETGIVFDDPIRHNTEVTVAGTTFARTIEMINGYSLTFENLTYSVRLAQSNNNLFDVENSILNPSGNVTVIAQNSAGLQIVSTGSGLSAAQSAQLELLYQDRGFDAANPLTVDESVGTLSVAGTIRTWVGNVIKTLTRTT